MCGLIAVLGLAEPSSRRRAGRALGLMSHRGPDGEGLAGIDDAGGATEEDAARLHLGHRRLAIIDRSAAGAQPMQCPETGNLIVFNGEIYNFLELRAALVQAGEHFRTESDTEVILAAWRRYGEKAFAEFNGMWAIVLFDRAAGRLVVSRDRLGVKPLYYAADGRRLVFASEIRAVLAALEMRPAPDPTAIFDFLALGITDQDERTMVEGVHAVPPGALWQISLGGAMQRGRFHAWPDRPADAAPDAAGLRELVSDSVRLRLRSDAPTVALLSGGLNSAIVTHVAATSRGLPRTDFRGAFTYGYGEEDRRHDETGMAQQLLAALPDRTPHIVHRVSARSGEAELMRMTTVLEGPPSTPSVLAALRLYEVIRAHGFKVALTGEGADELFAGYVRRYIPLAIADALRHGRAGEAIRFMRSPQANLPLVLNRLVWHLPRSMVAALLRRNRPNAAMIARPFWEAMSGRFVEAQADRRLALAPRLRRDTLATILPMMLRYTDRTSMASAVEARSPFLDWRIVELSLRLPAAAKLDPRGGKQLLRRAFAGSLPDFVLARPKTHGFGHAEQFRLADMRLDGLWERLPAAAHDFLDIPRLRRALAEPGGHTTLWYPLAVALWLAALEEGSLVAANARA